MQRPYIVGLGGTTRVGSSTEKALSLALKAVASQDADTLLLCGADLDLPASRIATELSRADGIILGMPGYHGGISGLVKNALDYTEELRGQAAVSRGTAGRMSRHRCRRARRGDDAWCAAVGGPRVARLADSLSVTVITSEPVFDAAGNCLSPRIEKQLRILSQQVLDFACKRQESLRAACTQAWRRVRLD
jgi:FMN reductase